MHNSSNMHPQFYYYDDVSPLYSCDRWFLNEDSSTASMKSVQTTTMVGHSTTTTGLSCFFHQSTALYVHKALFAHIIIPAALNFLNSFPTPSSHRFKLFHKLSFKINRFQFNISTQSLNPFHTPQSKSHASGQGI